MMRRVLMISPHFPPDSTAGTHRVRLLAPHLGAYGWEPTVLTVDPRDYEGALDPTLAASVPADLRVVRSRALPARLTRPLGVGDLGLRAIEGLWREASHLMGHEQLRRPLHHDLPGVPGAARAAPQEAIQGAVRARLPGSVGGRVGADGRS